MAIAAIFLLFQVHKKPKSSLHFSPNPYDTREVAESEFKNFVPESALVKQGDIIEVCVFSFFSQFFLNSSFTNQ